MKILSVTPYSATFEIDSATPFYSDDKFEIVLNDKVIREETRNVFSLFSLEPNTEYKLSVRNQTLNFKTSCYSKKFSVKSFNASGDGVTDDTAAFASAIACLPDGGVLYIPKGLYLLKPIFLKSNITLYLEKGAVLKGSRERIDYSVLPGLVDDVNLGTWQGEEDDCFASLITAINCHDIVIAGEGCIDCRATEGDWYKNHRIRRIAWRPRGIFMNRCKNVLIQGVTVKNTPSWNIHPYFCENVKLYDLYLENIPTMPTTDGIDPDCCDGVEIIGVKISVGDDCIALKAGTIQLAKKYKTPCKNVVVRNCLMCQGHGGVVLGSEISGGIQNVSVTKCLFDGTDRGFRIKTRRGRGAIGKCGNITFSGIVMKNVKVPFVINMYYNMGDNDGHTEYVWTTDKLPFDDRTPVIGSFVFDNIVCTDVEYCAGAFYGLPESPIESLKFKDVSFRFKNDAGCGYPDMREKNVAVTKQGLDFHFVKNVELNGVIIEGQDGQSVLIEEVQNLKTYKTE